MLKHLTKKYHSTGGRGAQGRISARHRGGARRRVYHTVEQQYRHISRTVLHFDTLRTIRFGGRIGVLLKDNRVISKVVLPHEKTGLSQIRFLKEIWAGATICGLTKHPGSNRTFCRAAGSSATLVAKIGTKFGVVRLPSGALKRVSLKNLAMAGIISNPEHSTIRLQKAGQNRWRGRRPVVRGVAMNPVDHPHGGGEGKSSGGRPSVSFRGKPTKGFKTTKRKKNKYITLLKTLQI